MSRKYNFEPIPKELRDKLMSREVLEEIEERIRQVAREQKPYRDQILDAERITGEDLRTFVGPCYDE